MKKSLYLLVLFLLASNFLDLKPIAVWLTNASGVVGLFTLFIWVALGLFTFSPKVIIDKRGGVNKPIYWIMVGVVLSMIPAYLYHGQSISTSIVAYRVQSFWIVALFLFYLQPSTSDIIKALNWFSLLYILAALIRTYVFPDWFFIPELSTEEITSYIKDSGELMWSKGLHLLLIPLYYYSWRYQQTRSSRDIITVLLYFVALFIVQNRSTLFLAVIIVGYSFIVGMKKKGLGFVWIIVAILLFFTWNVWVDLTEETISQLNNEDYNRVLAYNYYLFEANNDWITTVLGNGLLSTRVTSQMYDLWEAGIVNSDVGFIGYWNQFGLIPILVFFVVIIKALVAKTCPFFVKALGAHILGGALTMSYFGDPSTILWFSLFYYLFVYYTRINNSQYNLCYNKCLS